MSSTPSWPRQLPFSLVQLPWRPWFFVRPFGEAVTEASLKLWGRRAGRVLECIISPVDACHCGSAYCEDCDSTCWKFERRATCFKRNQTSPFKLETLRLRKFSQMQRPYSSYATKTSDRRNCFGVRKVATSSHELPRAATSHDLPRQNSATSVSSQGHLWAACARRTALDTLDTLIWLTISCPWQLGFSWVFDVFPCFWAVSIGQCEHTVWYNNIALLSDVSSLLLLRCVHTCAV